MRWSSSRSIGVGIGAPKSLCGLVVSTQSLWDRASVRAAGGFAGLALGFAFARELFGLPVPVDLGLEPFRVADRPALFADHVVVGVELECAVERLECFGPASAREELAGEADLRVDELLFEWPEAAAGLHLQLRQHSGVTGEESFDACERVLVADAEVARLKMANEALLV